jgi:hypothetical protein
MNTVMNLRVPYNIGEFLAASREGLSSIKLIVFRFRLVSLRDKCKFVWEHVLRRMCGSAREEVKEEWRKFHNEELQHLRPLSNIIRAIRPVRVTLARYV